MMTWSTFLRALGVVLFLGGLCLAVLWATAPEEEGGSLEGLAGLCMLHSAVLIFASYAIEQWRSDR